MAFLVYFLVLLITAGGVLFGFDWLSAPMSPMAPIKPVAVQVAKAPVPPPPAMVAPSPVRTITTAQPAVPTPAAPVRDIVTTVDPQAVPQPAPPIVSSEADAVAGAPAMPSPQETPATNEIAAQEPAPKCDVTACTAAYRSFTASDCTYQPLVGPRRLCAKGVVPGDETASTAASARADAGSRSDARCNVTACAAAYTSFNPADCTYQPFDGPRRICEKP